MDTKQQGHTHTHTHQIPCITTAKIKVKNKDRQLCVKLPSNFLAMTLFQFSFVLRYDIYTFNLSH